jgi:glycosidase
LLIHAVILTVGGIPLIYLGDELGTLNDYAYRNDPVKAGDSRWVHRPFFDWDRAARRDDTNMVEGRIFQGLQRLIALRRSQPAIAGGDMQPVETGSPAVLGYARSHQGERVLIFANFSENPQMVPANHLRLHGLTYENIDCLTGTPYPLQDLALEPFAFVCLAPA